MTFLLFFDFFITLKAKRANVKFVQSKQIEFCDYSLKVEIRRDGGNWWEKRWVIVERMRDVERLDGGDDLHDVIQLA